MDDGEGKGESEEGEEGEVDMDDGGVGGRTVGKGEELVSDKSRHRCLAVAST